MTPVGGSARRVVALAALMFAGFSFVTVEIAPVGLLPAISADLDVSLSAVGLLVTFYGLTVAVASIPLTQLVGAVPRRYLLSGLLAVFVAATCLSVAGPSYWALTAGRVATALSQAVFWSVAAPAAVALFSPHVRGRVTSALFAAPALATVLGVPAVTWLGQQAGWRAAFLAVAGLGLLALLGIATLIPANAARGKPLRCRIGTPHAPLPGHHRRDSPGGHRRVRRVHLPCSVPDRGQRLLDRGHQPPVVRLRGSRRRGCRGWRRLGRPVAPTAVFLPVLLLTLALIGLYAFGTHQGVVLALIPLFGFAVAQALHLPGPSLDVAPGKLDVASAWFSSAYNIGIAAGALIGGLLLPHTGVRSTYLMGALLTTLALAALASTHIPSAKTRP